MKVLLLFLLLSGIALIIAEYCADSYETGVRAGYEMGLEEGIRITNEVITEVKK